MIALAPLPDPLTRPRFRVRTDRLEIRTAHPLQIVDITEKVAGQVFRSRVTEGVASIQTTHTTTAIVVNEDEPLLHQDVRRTLERLVPGLDDYRHDDLAARVPAVPPGERRNGAAHCRAFLMPSSASLTIADGLLALGRWQRVFLVELDGPQLRRVSVTVLGLGPARRA